MPKQSTHTNTQKNPWTHHPKYPHVYHTLTTTPDNDYEYIGGILFQGDYHKKWNNTTFQLCLINRENVKDIKVHKWLTQGDVRHITKLYTPPTIWDKLTITQYLNLWWSVYDVVMEEKHAMRHTKS